MPCSTAGSASTAAGARGIYAFERRSSGGAATPTAHEIRDADDQNIRGALLPAGCRRHRPRAPAIRGPPGREGDAQPVRARHRGVCQQWGIRTAEAGAGTLTDLSRAMSPWRSAGRDDAASPELDHPIAHASRHEEATAGAGRRARAGRCHRAEEDTWHDPARHVRRGEWPRGPITAGPPWTRAAARRSPLKRSSNGNVTAGHLPDCPDGACVRLGPTHPTAAGPRLATARRRAGSRSPGSSSVHNCPS